MTYQFFAAQPAGVKSKEGGLQPKSYLNITETGDSVNQMTREFSLRNGYVLFSSHLKVIVISEDLIRKYSLEQLLNQFLRDSEIRPSCLVFISKGTANRTLELKNTGELPSFQLIEIADNENLTTRILPPMPLAKLMGKMQSGSSFLLQNVITANGEVKFYKKI